MSHGVQRVAADVQARHLARARQLHLLGRFAEAEQEYRTILAADADHVEALQLLGVLAAQRGETAAALILLGRATTLAPERLDIRNNQAVVYKFCGRYSEAEKAFRACLEVERDDAQAWNNLGTVLHDLGRFAEAEEALGHALALDPAFAVARKNLAAVFQDAGRTEEAVTVYERLEAAGSTDPELYYNHALMRRYLGEPERAETLLRRSLALRPEYAEAELILAQVLDSLGRSEEAQSHAHRAQGNEQDVAVQFRLGRAFHQLGRWTDAIRAYRRVLAVSPDGVDVLVPAAQVFNKLSQPVPAERCARRALEINTTHRGAHEALATALVYQGREKEAQSVLAVLLETAAPDAALLCSVAELEIRVGDRGAAAALIDRVLAQEENHPAAWHLRGQLLAERGEMAAAIEAYRHAWQAHPSQVESGCDIARLKRFESAADEDFQHLLAWDGRRERLLPDRRAQLDFALGKGWAEIGEFERAFTHYVRGNEAKKEILWYDEPSQEQLFERLLEAFPAETFKRLCHQGSRDETPVFILGMPRSGSTLVEQILAAHPDVSPGGERRTVKRLISGLWPEATGGIPVAVHSADFEEQIAHFSQEYLEDISQVLQGALRVTDKMPGNFLYAGLLRIIFPRARIIYTRRNPMDNCLSCYMTLFSSGHEYSYDLAWLGRMYQLHDRVMAHWRAMPDMDLFEISYERLVADFEAEARRLVEYVGLPWSPRCLQFHTVERAVSTASLAQVRRPIYTSSVGKWHRYATQLAPLAEALGISEAEASALDDQAVKARLGD